MTWDDVRGKNLPVGHTDDTVFQRLYVMDKKYDYLIVGSGLFGATFAYCAKKAGKKCLVIDKRPHLGGNVYCENIEDVSMIVIRVFLSGV